MLVCVCVCVRCVYGSVSLNIWMWSRELTFTRLAVSISHMQTHSSGWRAANVPLIPATAALLTVISNSSLDQLFVMTGEMLSVPSGWCWGEADTVKFEIKCGWSLAWNILNLQETATDLNIKGTLYIFGPNNQLLFLLKTELKFSGSTTNLKMDGLKDYTQSPRD